MESKLKGILCGVWLYPFLQEFLYHWGNSSDFSAMAHLNKLATELLTATKKSPGRPGLCNNEKREVIDIDIKTTQVEGWVGWRLGNCKQQQKNWSITTN